MHLYPESSAAELRRAIGEAFGLNPDRIVCGNGSDELLHLLPQIYCAPGDEVLYSAHGFIVYPIVARAASATPVTVPEPELRTDIDALLARATDKTKIVFVTNPNNPTGSYNTAAELRRLRSGLPKDCLLVIDAAYADYVERNDFESGIELVATTENTVMTRTFSKIHGLAALARRLGLRAGQRRRRAEPHPRSLQRLNRRPSRRRRRDPRQGARSDGEGAQHEVARLAHGTDRGDRPQSVPERRQFPADRVPGNRRERPPPPPTSS